VADVKREGSELALSNAPSLRQRAFMPDVLKAVAIFGVVFIHSGSAIGETVLTRYIADLFRFCVPVFITIWAYFLERTYHSGLSWKFIIPLRFIALAVPFFFWSFLYFLLKPDLLTVSPTAAITKYWSGYGWSGQYFFIILFQLIVVFPFIRLLLGGIFSVGLMFVTFAVVFSIMMTLVLPDWFLKIGDRPFIYWLPYVALGIYLARHPHRVLSIGWAVIGLLLIAAESALTTPRPGDFFVYTKPFLLLGSGLIASAFINSNYLKGKGTNGLAQLISLIGSSTMGIFLINPLLSDISRAIIILFDLPAVVDPAESLVTSLLTSTVVLFICLSATMALKQIRLGKLVS
jgi:hypothetical protein